MMCRSSCWRGGGRGAGGRCRDAASHRSPRAARLALRASLCAPRAAPRTGIKTLALARALARSLALALARLSLSRARALSVSLWRRDAMSRRRAATPRRDAAPDVAPRCLAATRRHDAASPRLGACWGEPRARDATAWAEVVCKEVEITPWTSASALDPMALARQRRTEEVEGAAAGIMAGVLAETFA